MSILRNFFSTGASKFSLGKKLLCPQTSEVSLPAFFPARSWLFTAKTARGFVKANQAKADVIVLDLEDSVPQQLKAKMRQEYLRALQNGVFNNVANVFVRLNQEDDYDELVEDTKYLTIPEVSGFILPKVKSVSSLDVYEELVHAAERDGKMMEGSLKFVPIMETTDAFFKAEQIARGSPRNVALILGSADFMTESYSEEHSPTYFTHASQVVIASRAAKIQPIAGVCDKIDDHISSEKFYRKMKACGFAGAATLTPSQTLQANNEFSASPKEVKWSKSVLSLTGISTIQPSIQESRQMIGPPHRHKASAIHQQSKQIQKISTPTSAQPTLLCGERLTHGLQHTATVGQTSYSPLEITVTESWRTSWEKSFLTTNRFATSVELALKLGLKAIPLPFTLLNTMALALSVTSFSETARVHLGCYDAVQSGAVFPGDTMRCTFRIDDARQVQSQRGSLYTVVDSSHCLVNQNDQAVFSVRKRTMFPPLSIDKQEQGVADRNLELGSSDWKRFLINQPTNLLLPVGAQPELSTGDLLIHNDYKVFGLSETRMMCRLFKITNAHHHNITRYSPSDILVPGPFIIAAMLSNTERDVGEVVYEEYPVSTNINKVNPGDQIGSLTYVESFKQLDENPELEEITLKHIGVKNVDLRWLVESGVPAELFRNEIKKPAEYEALCASFCPLLYRKIACQASRKIVRVSRSASDRHRKSK